MAKTLTIKQEYYIKAPTWKVFHGFTSSEKLKVWFLQKARIEPKKGGMYKFTWIGGYTNSGKVLDCVKDKKLVLDWPQGKLGTTKATFTFKKKGKGTLLYLTHSGFGTSPSWIEMYSGTKSGWAYYIMNLKSLIGGGKDLRSPEDLAV